MPGLHLEYGPSQGYKTWSELYVIYHQETSPAFESAGLVNCQRPVWYVKSTALMRSSLEEMDERVYRMGSVKHGIADWLDRSMEMLITETLLSSTVEKNNPLDNGIERATQWVRKNFHQTVEWDLLARQCGMSLATFRRKWLQHYSQPPGKTLRRWRMREASRLLVESDLSVYEVAEMVGVEDALYFSRVFRKEFNLSPREYRKAYRLAREVM
jgi:AraC-like DNA-binding protein